VTSFDDSLRRHFPGAQPIDQYLAGLRAAVEPEGFVPERTLALASICRDELTTPFLEQVKQDWGDVFTLAGLGGVPALGRTGWQAALAHIPDASGRGCLLVFGLPHIGIERDGTVGVTIRRGQTAPTTTCGALSAICAMSREGTLPREVDVDDYEETRLALRLVDPDGAAVDLVDLTMRALDALEADIWHALDEAEVWRDHDVAVCCGVQIHGPGGTDWVWPRDAVRCDRDGQRHPFRR
jgi:hypothetical protein